MNIIQMIDYYNDVNQEIMKYKNKLYCKMIALIDAGKFKTILPLDH
jgi:hypothetical protein